ncbi:MAG: recombinase family protein [Sphingorhabdus sp.]|uniref:recombinase family protein n=1 Tax=Sphingorhabdus sp. TaxID=1902408 RepID=UPI0025CBAA6E|nr:recombinase family protein [Sphingorhabdus sp.]MCO4090737.1 recombinase family protein [Sphingorhabdus sp.]
MFYGYIRVSTDRQAISGLGLDAQRQSIELYAAQQGTTLTEIFVETESGTRNDRPQLHAAITLCRKHKATLVIAKLDRLARNVAFVSSLMETGVEFVAVDAPFANRLMIHVLSAVAEWEREQISVRTKAALTAAKARGVKLGTHGAVLASQRKAEAYARARTLQPYIVRAQYDGCTSLRQIAGHLNSASVAAPGGGLWHASNVHRVMNRLNLPGTDQTYSDGTSPFR